MGMGIGRSSLCGGLGRRRERGGPPRWGGSVELGRIVLMHRRQSPGRGTCLCAEGRTGALVRSNNTSGHTHAMRAETDPLTGERQRDQRRRVGGKHELFYEKRKTVLRCYCFRNRSNFFATSSQRSSTSTMSIITTRRMDPVVTGGNI